MIKTLIETTPAARALLPDTQAIASLLSQGRTRLEATPIGFGSVLIVLGAEAGPAFLDALSALRSENPTLKWAWTLLERGELDVSTNLVREQLDLFVLSSMLTTEQAAALKALAERPDPISEFAVRQAIYNDDGTLAVQP